MSGQIETWTDVLGRTYQYTPAEPDLIARARISFSSEVTLALAEASRALGSIPEMPATGIATVLYRSEASASSLIEGVGPSPRRVLEAEFAGIHELEDDSARRVVANLTALRAALTTPVPAKVEDMLTWHWMLMEGHPGLRPDTIGALRTVQNWIGGDAFGPRNAVYVPPRPVSLAPLLTDLVAFCGRTDLAPLALSALAHAQFEMIHPFVDGNGRVGRMLLQQLLVNRLTLTAPVPISVPWSRGTERYIAGLRSFQEGDVDSWLLLVSWSVIETVDWMRMVRIRLDDLLDRYRESVKTRGRSVTAMIIEDLPSHPVVDTPTVASRYEVTSQSAHDALVRLADAGVLTEKSFSRRKKGRPRRVFEAVELISLLEG